MSISLDSLWALMGQVLQFFDGYEGHFWITPSGCGSSTATALMHIFRPTSLSGKGIRARHPDRIRACIQHRTHPASIIYSQKKCRPCSLRKTPGSGPAARSRRPCSRPAQSPRPSTSRSARPRASDNARTERERAQGAHQCVHVKFCSSCAAVRRGRYTVFEVAPCSPTGDTRMRGP